MMTIAQRHEEYLQKIKDLRLIDDDFMKVVFKDEDCVKYILQTVLQEDYQYIISSETEYDMKNLHGRSNRIDILAIDINGRNINVEFQKYQQGASVKRARRHVSLVDVNMSKEKERLDQLKEVLTIFFTLEDELKNGLSISHIHRYVDETKEMVNDGTQIIYIPVNIRDGSVLDLLKEDLLEKDPSKIHSKVLQRRMRYLKESEEGQEHMCKIFEEVKEKGIEEGKEEAKEDFVKAMLMNEEPIEKIEKYTGFHLDRIMRIKNDMVYA